MRIRKTIIALLFIFLCIFSIGCDEYYTTTEKNIEIKISEAKTIYDIVAYVDEMQREGNGYSFNGGNITVFNGKEELELFYHNENKEYQYFISLDDYELEKIVIVSGSSKAFSGSSDTIDWNNWNVDYYELKEMIKKEKGVTISRVILLGDKWIIRGDNGEMLDYDLLNKTIK